MRILLDENFPLALAARLRGEGHRAEHIIELGLRGIHDREIARRFLVRDEMALTQDEESFGIDVPDSCVVSAETRSRSRRRR